MRGFKPKPKIITDAVSLLTPLTGIGRYTYEIAKQLEESSEFKCNYFYGYHSKELLQNDKRSSLKNMKSLLEKSAIAKKIARKTSNILNRLFPLSYDLYWQPNFIPLKTIKAKKTVTSVHDFSFILHKDFHPKERIEYFESNFFQNIYQSDIIITGSNFSKEEIIQRLDFPSEKIKVIYHGLDHNVFKVYDDTRLDFDLPEKFILSVGSVEPRKNIVNLLKAYSYLPQELKETYKLVFVGFQGWNNKEIMELIEKDKKNIHYLGYIKDIELAKVYNRASLFLFPSFYEGFGLPVLEAMACATPVVCSDSSSLPEVGEDAVLYCKADDFLDIKNKVAHLLNDVKLQEKMILKGLQRAQLFSWKKSADEHKKIFQELLIENRKRG